MEVVSNVVKAGMELKGRRGRVMETWEKCNVDPTCCCAEFVDDNFAVLVRFDGPLDASCGNGGLLLQETFFTHYFHEEELRNIKERGDWNRESVE